MKDAREQSSVDHDEEEKRESNLVTFDEIPSWQKDNKFILTGYRLNYTVRMCLRSLFFFHNEWGNVWTHLLGLAFFIIMSTYFFSRILFLAPSHVTVFTLFISACMLCMGCSSTYHLFRAHYCEKVFNRMVLADYFGITCLIVGSFIPLLWYTFACHTTWRIVYLAMISTLGSAGLVGPFFNFFDHPKFFIYRTMLFVVMTASGIIPTIHFVIIVPLNGTTIPFLGGLALMFLFYSAGVIIYALRFPERMYPGHFDIWFQSHQIWHVFVLAAAVVHFFTCVGMYRRWAVMPDNC